MKLIFGLIAITIISACGVKGKPMPPEEPAIIGNGLPQQSSENLKKNKSETNKNGQGK